MIDIEYIECIEPYFVSANRCQNLKLISKVDNENEQYKRPQLQQNESGSIHLYNRNMILIMQVLADFCFVEL